MCILATVDALVQHDPHAGQLRSEILSWSTIKIIKHWCFKALNLNVYVWLLFVMDTHSSVV